MTPNVFLLYCLSGAERGKRYELEPGQSLTIGRDPGEHGIHISDILASRMHLSVTVHDGYLEIKDLSSANGSRLNSHLIEDTAKAELKDIITLGHTSFLVEDQQKSTAQSMSSDHIVRRHNDSQRMRRDYDKRKTLHVEPVTHSDNSSSDSTLSFLCSSLPLAILILDQNGLVILANDKMKHLCGSDISAAQSSEHMLEQLANHLVDRSELDKLINTNSYAHISIETIDGQIWTAWCYRQNNMIGLYILE